LVFIFPHNINNNIHIVGAAIMVASLWALTGLFLFEARRFVPLEKFIVQQSTLQVAVLTYATAYMYDLPIKNIAQKFAVLGLIIVLKVATAKSKICRLSQIFNFSQKNKHS
jgi:hypothetical protein